MDIFALTETEFFRKLTDGENDNLHIAYKDFVLQVSELCNSSKCKGNVITALLLVEVEITTKMPYLSQSFRKSSL